MPEPAVDQAPPVDKQLAQRDLVIKLLAKVSEEDRSLILLKEVEGHSVNELMEMTGASESVCCGDTRTPTVTPPSRMDFTRSAISSGLIGSA